MLYFGSLYLFPFTCRNSERGHALIMLKSNMFLSGACHEVHITVSGASQHSELYWQFPFWAENIYKYASLGTSRNYSHIFFSQGAVLSFFFGDAVWHHSILSCFISEPKWQNQLSSRVMIFSRMSSPLAACHWSDSNNTSMSSNNNKLSSIPVLIFSCTVLCPVPSYTMMSLIVTHCSQLWCFLVHPCRANWWYLCFLHWSVSPIIPSLLASMQKSSKIWQSQWKMFAAEVVLLQVEFNCSMPAKWCIIQSHFVIVD
jgi:hypothetical protein